MRTNVEKVLERDKKLSELQDSADALEQGASQFEKQAGKLKSKFWWKNCKVSITSITIISNVYIWPVPCVDMRCSYSKSSRLLLPTMIIMACTTNPDQAGVECTGQSWSWVRDGIPARGQQETEAGLDGNSKR
ncbi:VAMP2 [Cordylochernes scorpioides]|uniref:VAMP2 n=1 Tax=Cordylochernes scorpioides TaxID=51811 RepID=A0ABY6KAX9_9ARAC|nr:VAMP2 [Cordylochernes scorpioides]